MDAKVQKSIVENVPWLALEFADNSDFASIGNAKDEQSVEIEDIARGEDFIQAGVGINRRGGTEVDSHVLGTGNWCRKGRSGCRGIWYDVPPERFDGR